MRRRLIAAAWIMGATIPLLMATVLVAGCCVLPFHNVVHKLMPVCEMAMNVIRGGADDEHEHDATPAREKQDPVQRIATVMPNAFRLATSAAARTLAHATTTGYRSFITLGAIRCDRDVGLHVLVETFLI
jgi:hypothetical protein